MYHKYMLTVYEILPGPKNIQNLFAGAGVNRDFVILQLPGPGLDEFSRGRYFSTYIQYRIQ